MFAILLNNENVGTIASALNQPHEVTQKVMQTFLRSSKKWYFIQPFVDRKGHVIDWTILPENRIRADFTYDKSTIDEDWTWLTR